jgi:hypothetical protein
VQLGGNLLGDTKDSELYAPLGTVLLNRSGTASAPQLLEAMGQDLGAVAAGTNPSSVDPGTAAFTLNVTGSLSWLRFLTISYRPVTVSSRLGQFVVVPLP